MKLLILIGAQASGKMTVGQAISRITPMKLFHNHMTIEPVIDLFGAYNARVTERLRQVVFEEFLRSDNYGLIFTFLWAFESPVDAQYIEWLSKMYRDAGAQVDYVELICPQEERLRRNRTENRLREKTSKRDVALSEQRIITAEEHHRCVSEPGEFPYERYLRLDNSLLSPRGGCGAHRRAFRLRPDGRLTRFSRCTEHPEASLPVAQTIFERTECGTDGLAAILSFEA